MDCVAEFAHWLSRGLSLTTAHTLALWLARSLCVDRR